MAITAQLAPKLAIGGYNWTANASAVDFGVDIATQDVTTFEYVPYTNAVAGLKTLMVATTGFNDHTTGALGLDTWLAANHGTSQILSLAYTGETVGNAGILAQGIMGGSARHFNATVGSVSTTVASVGNGIMAEGLVTQASTTSVTATTTSTTQQVGALTTGRTMYASVHVLSTSGTPSMTAQLASAATSGGSYTLRGSATAALTAPGAVLASTTTVTTDTWWRLALTVSGGSPVLSVFAVIALL